MSDALKRKGIVAACVRALLALAAAGAAAAPVVPYKQAAGESKKDGRSMITLCIGTGWMKDAGRFEAAFKQAAAADAAEKAVWALYDMREELDDAGRKALGKLPLEIYGYPAWIFTDGKGRLIAHRESIALSEAAALPRTVEALEQKRKRRDAALARAESAEGREKAALIGRALAETLDPVIDGLPFRISNMYRARYWDLINQIQDADPDDETGYGFKYTFWFQPVMEGKIKRNNGKKEFDKNYEAVRKKLALSVLTPRQRQQLLLFNYATAKDAGDWEAAMKWLDRAAAVAPESPFAADCRRMKRYHTEPVELAGPFWRPSDNRPRWTRMTMDASDFIRGPGVYSIEFRHSAGRTKFRNPVLRAGGRAIAVARGEKNAFELTVNPPLPPDRILLTVEGMGTGWFAGRGEIVIKKK